MRDKVTDYRVVVEPREFYALVPGSERLKPTQETPIPGLYLAGDYTRQRYLATMEGAVYSGRLAATAILKRLS
jgi:15-cis-phytoene desaturase